jgi:MFS family permease
MDQKAPAHISAGDCDVERLPTKPLQPDDAPPSEAQGVRKVEAFNKALYQSGRSGRILLITLVASISLTMIGYALDQGITYQFTVIAASSFNHHAQIGAVNTASQIIRGVSKPFIGKLADITSRPTTYVVVLVFYVIGFVVAATCDNIASYTIGISFTAFGKSGLDLLGDVIVGDLTPLQWRAFWSGLLASPFLFTTFINGFISEAFIPDQWRWGLGMFAIMMPVLLIPAIWTLYGMQRKADKFGMVSMADAGRVRRDGLEVQVHGARHWMSLGWQAVVDMDLAGIILLGFAWSLILLPLNLAEDASNGWSNSSMIAMLVIGCVTLVIFGLFEAYVAPKPLMTKRILLNRAFMLALAVDVTNQMASSTKFSYFSSYIYIIKPWTNYQWTVFLNSTTVVLCLFGPIGGLIHRATHRYKHLMIFGAGIKLVGYAILIKGPGLLSTQSTAALVISQIFLGLGAFSVIGARVGSQASVPHEDLASVIALLSLWSTIGSSIGSTIASSIWTAQMVDNMRTELPDVPESTIKKIYGSIKILRTDYDWEDPVRRGAIQAYTQTNGVIFIAATVIAIVPFIGAMGMPNYYLGKQQNAVSNRGLDGELVEVPAPREKTASSQTSIWSRIKHIW